MLPETLLARVCEARGIAKSKVTGPSRQARIALVRHEAMYLLRTLCKLSFPEIGRLVGHRDHSTVVHAVGKVRALVAADAEYADELRDLSRPEWRFVTALFAEAA